MEQDHISRREAADKKKEEHDLTKDIAFDKTSAIPDSYLFQPESDSRRWMLKRGKSKMCYFDNE
jgi:hypothetical protein